MYLNVIIGTNFDESKEEPQYGTDYFPTEMMRAKA